MANKKTRGVYSLILKIEHNKKELCIPIFEREKYRYNVDVITIDHFLFSEWMQAKDKEELREKLLWYVIGISNKISAKDKLFAEDKKLLKQCNALIEELRILRHNYDFYIEGPVPGKKNAKKPYPIIYQPTMLLYYFNELYNTEEKKFDYQKEAFRKSIMKHNQMWNTLSRELFNSLVYDYAIYQELYDQEKQNLYRLFSHISTYKAYQKDDYHMSTEQGKEDHKNFSLEELSRYPILRSILNHEVILENSHIDRLNKEIYQYYASLFEPVEATDLDEFYNAYDLENLPDEIKKHADGSGERKSL